MHSAILDLLADPVDGSPLHLSGTTDRDDWLEEGTLTSTSGTTYRVSGGIPRFVDGASDAPGSAASTFGYKWSQRHSYESLTFRQWYRSWLLGKYGFEDDEAVRSFFANRQRVLEVGCGSGLSAELTLTGHGPSQVWVGLDISRGVDIALERLGHEPSKDFVQADLLAPPFARDSFDIVFAEGVLHHTISTERAFKTLVPMIRSGGEFMFYVYRRKAPVREYTDDYIRSRLASMTEEEAWDALRPLTSLARALSEMGAIVDVPEDVPLLGLHAGKQDVQRLLYWNFAKLFWNDSLSFEGNNMVNFDWYRPTFAWRHTRDEIHSWCAAEGLSIAHFDEQESGFTVRATRG